MRICRNGVTRIVILIGPFAIKLPRFDYGWAAGLRGLLCNMQEVTAWTTRWPELCPVLFGFPGGLFIVMRRAKPLSDDQWDTFDFEKFINVNDGMGRVPAECKPDSFGLIDGRIVAVDYGS